MARTSAQRGTRGMSDEAKLRAFLAVDPMLPDGMCIACGADLREWSHLFECPWYELTERSPRVDVIGHHGVEDENGLEQ